MPYIHPSALPIRDISTVTVLTEATKAKLAEQNITTVKAIINGSSCPFRQLSTNQFNKCRYHKMPHYALALPIDIDIDNTTIITHVCFPPLIRENHEIYKYLAQYPQYPSARRSVEFAKHIKLPIDPELRTLYDMTAQKTINEILEVDMGIAQKSMFQIAPIDKKQAEVLYENNITLGINLANVCAPPQNTCHLKQQTHYRVTYSGREDGKTYSICSKIDPQADSLEKAINVLLNTQSILNLSNKSILVFSNSSASNNETPESTPTTSAQGQTSEIKIEYLPPEIKNLLVYPLI